MAAEGTGEVKWLDILVNLQTHDREDSDENLNCTDVPQRIRCAELRFVVCILGTDLAREVYVKLP